MLRHLAIPLLLPLALVLATSCVPVEDGGEDGSTSLPLDASLGDVSIRGDAGGEVHEWPPDLADETEGVTIGQPGGTFEVFDGQVTFTIPEDAYSEDTTITVTRSIVNVGGHDWVGYIWGDHGYPVLDPPTEVVVHAPLAYVPTGPGPPEGLALYVVRVDTLDPLPETTTTLESDEVVMTGLIHELGTLVIATP